MYVLCVCVHILFCLYAKQSDSKHYYNSFIEKIQNALNFYFRLKICRIIKGRESSDY